MTRASSPREAATLESGFFEVQACNDTNRVDAYVFAHGAQAVLVARLDDLGQRPSGAALQGMNVLLGMDEALGLS